MNVVVGEVWDGGTDEHRGDVQQTIGKALEEVVLARAEGVVDRRVDDKLVGELGVKVADVRVGGQLRHKGRLGAQVADIVPVGVAEGKVPLDLLGARLARPQPDARVALEQPSQ